MFYELKHPVNVDYFSVERGENFSFPSHIHYHFEIIMLTKGEMTVTVGANEYFLTPGKAILVFPNQIHSLTSDGNSSHILCVFTPKLVNHFFKSKQRNLPVSNILKFRHIAWRCCQHSMKTTISARSKGYFICCAEFSMNRLHIQTAGMMKKVSFSIRYFHLSTIIFRMIAHLNLSPTKCLTAMLTSQNISSRRSVCHIIVM